jgi:hypothetical protein
LPLVTLSSGRCESENVGATIFSFRFRSPLSAVSKQARINYSNIEMSLQQKILKLRMDALVAARHAAFWQHAIDVHGSDKATAFYTHLGLNHLERKSVEWEGMTLSREPKEHEKIAVKGIAQAQESAKESIGKVLLDLRADLITDGLKRISKMKPADYHELVLQVPKESSLDLRNRLIKVYRQGQNLVAEELNIKKSAFPLTEVWKHDCPFEFGNKEIDAADDFDSLDLLTDLTTSRVANDVQSRIIAAAARFSLLGQTGDGLILAVTNEINTGSVSYIDRAATGLANRVINIGRSDEAENRRDEWERVEYSALLDQNVCQPCADEDGKTANDEDDLQPTPNPECAGGDWCRCFHVYVNQ